MECKFCGKTDYFFRGCSICSKGYNVCFDCADKADTCQTCLRTVCTETCRYNEAHTAHCSKSFFDDRSNEDKAYSAKKQKSHSTVQSIFSFNPQEKTNIFFNETKNQSFDEDFESSDSFWDSMLTEESDNTNNNNNSNTSFFEESEQWFDKSFIFDELPIENSLNPLPTNSLTNLEDNSVFSYFFDENEESKHDTTPQLSLNVNAPALFEDNFNTVQKSDLEIGIVTWNINHFQTNINKKKSETMTAFQGRIEKARQMRERKKASLQRMFKQHDWLDIMILQEINASSLKEFKSAFQVGDETCAKLAYELGEKMTNVNARGYKGEEEENEEEQEEIEEQEEETGDTVKIDGNIYPKVLGQQEYYPIIYRADRVKHLCSTAYQGKVKFDGQPGFFEWSKNKKYPGVFHQRPIIVHQLEVVNSKSKNKLINIAVVHTSPVGKGLGRMGEYEQIEEFLDFVKTDKSALWIIAGDFYLDPESTVVSNTNVIDRPKGTLFKTKVEGFGLNFVVSTSATNQSRLTDKATKPREKKLAQREKLKTKLLKDPQTIVDYLRKYKAKKLKNEMSEFKERILEDIKKDPKNVKKYLGFTELYKADKIDSRLREFPDKKSHVVNKRADFFLCSAEFSYNIVGLIRPSGGLLDVDLEHYALNWWRGISDHAPVGAVLSNSANLPKQAKIQKDKEILFKSHIEEARKKLRKIQEVALEELCKYFPHLVRGAFILIWESDVKSDGIALARYCYYLEEVLNDSRWKEIIAPPGTLITDDIFQGWMPEIQNVSLEQILQKWNAAVEENCEVWSEEYGEIAGVLEKSLRSLNTLGYTISDADFSGEETYEKLEASLINFPTEPASLDNNSSDNNNNPNKEEVH